MRLVAKKKLTFPIGALSSHKSHCVGPVRSYTQNLTGQRPPGRQSIRPSSRSHAAHAPAALKREARLEVLCDELAGAFCSRLAPAVTHIGSFTLSTTVLALTQSRSAGFSSVNSSSQALEVTTSRTRKRLTL